MIGLKTSVADRPHRVALQNPGAAVSDGDGGFTQSWTDLNPVAINVSIEPATAENLERAGLGTVTSMATHVIHGPYHPQVTTATRLQFNGAFYSVTSVADVELRHVEMVLACVQVVP